MGTTQQITIQELQQHARQESIKGITWVSAGILTVGELSPVFPFWATLLMATGFVIKAWDNFDWASRTRLEAHHLTHEHESSKVTIEPEPPILSPSSLIFSPEVQPISYKDHTAYGVPSAFYAPPAPSYPMEPPASTLQAVSTVERKGGSYVPGHIPYKYYFPAVPEYVPYVPYTSADSALDLGEPDASKRPFMPAIAYLNKEERTILPPLPRQQSTYLEPVTSIQAGVNGESASKNSER